MLFSERPLGDLDDGIQHPLNLRGEDLVLVIDDLAELRHFAVLDAHRGKTLFMDALFHGVER